MLTKLFKYEIKSTARQFLSVYLILIGLSVILKTFNELSEKLEIMILPSALFMFLYVVTVIGMFIVTVITVIQRFYKNLIGDEGYLMFTLPLTVKHHILVKTVTAVFWTLTGIITALFSILIIAFYGSIFSNVSGFISTLYNSLKAEYGIDIYLFALLAGIITILVLAANYLMIFTAVSIGQLFRSHRTAASVGAYFMLYIINQILSVITVSIFSSVNKTLWIRFLNNDLSVVLALSLVFASVAAALLACFYFICSSYILKNRLNLE